MNQDFNFGAILFNQTKTNSVATLNRKYKRKEFTFKGTLCICNQKPIYFDNLHQLRTLLKEYKDTTFVTNLSKEDVWLIGSFEQIKDKYFFGQSIDILINQNAYINNNNDQNVQNLAEVFYRVMKYISEQNNNQEIEINDGNLPDILHQLYFHNFFKARNDRILFGLEKAYQERIILTDDHSFDQKDKLYISLDVEYSSTPLNQFLPLGEWKKFSLSSSDFETQVNEIKENGALFLIQIDNIEFKNSFTYNQAKLLLGNKSQELNNTVQDYIWLTEQELIFIAPYIKCDITEIYIAEITKPFNIKNYIDKKFTFTDTPIDLLSMSSRIFKNALLISLMDDTYLTTTREETPFNEIQIWLQAKSRIMMTNKIKLILEQFPKLPLLGYTVFGEIILDANYELSDELIKALLDNGFIIPQDKATIDLFNENFYYRFEFIDKLEENEKLVFNAYLDYWVKYQWLKNVKKENNADVLKKGIMIYFDRLFNTKIRNFDKDKYKTFLMNTLSSIDKINQNLSIDDQKVNKFILSYINNIVNTIIGDLENS